MKRKKRQRWPCNPPFAASSPTALAMGDARLAASITEMHNADDLEAWRARSTRCRRGRTDGARRCEGRQAPHPENQGTATRSEAAARTKVEVGFSILAWPPSRASTNTGRKPATARDCPSGRPSAPPCQPCSRQSATHWRATPARAWATSPNAAIEAGARDALEAMVNSYMHAPGPPVGERQAGRKAGTPGAGRSWSVAKVRS